MSNTNELLKKLARIEASSICRLPFANVFVDCFCVVRTQQLEFANTSVPTGCFICGYACIVRVDKSFFIKKVYCL